MSASRDVPVTADEIEQTFSAGRPWRSLSLLAHAVGDGLDAEMLIDAVAVLHRTHGIGAATGALALAAADGAATTGLQTVRGELEQHRLQRLVPEVVGRIVFAALRQPGEPEYDAERWPDGKETRSPEDAVSTVRYLIEHAEELEWAADRLDADSRETLIQRLVYLTLDDRRAHIGPPAAELRQHVEVARELLRTEERVRGLGHMDSVRERDFLYSHRFDLHPIDFPIRLETTMFGVQATFQLEQYRAPGHPEAWPREGDVVIDGGGYLGETALWLAHAVGRTGRVHTFELEDQALGVLTENLRANPDLAERIVVVQRALWASDDEELEILVSGPGTSVMNVAADHASGQIARTVTIDGLLDAGTLPRVDFIKLDIEGAEPQALRGAERTLARHRPRLALAAYHRFDDVWMLMRQIDELDLGYQFALAHFTPHHEETVLYAWVPEQ